jgi:hypothetical protein
LRVYIGSPKARKLTHWNGWIKVQTLPIRSEATGYKAQVIAVVTADVLLLCEVEDRASLEEFNQTVLPNAGCAPYAQTFVPRTVICAA